MLRKNGSILLASLLAASILASCGDQEQMPSQLASGENGGATSSSGQTADSQPDKVSILTTNTSDYETREGIALLEDKTNTELSFTFIGKDTAKEKFNIMVQSNSLPDVVIDAVQFGNASELYRLGKEGVFLPLNDLIEQNGPNLKAVWKEHSEYLDAATAPDGNIYALPAYYYGLGQEVRTHLFIEKKFLQNVGMDTPKTTEEFYQYLKAVKETDANGNGNPDDEIPLISWESDANGSVLRSVLMGAFSKVSIGENRVVDNGKIAYYPAGEGYREGLKYIARLYQEGLLYSESFSLDRNTIWTLAENDPNVNTLGAATGHHANFVCNWESPRWKDYEAVGALTGPDGQAGTVPQNPNMTIQLKTLIASTCKAPEAAMRLCDYMATEDGAKLAFWGIEGHDWTAPSANAVDKDGQPASYRAIPAGEQPEGFVQGLLGHGWPTFQSAALLSNEVDPKAGWLSAADKFSSHYYEKLYESALRPSEEYWPSIIYFDAAALDELALLQTDLDSTVKLAEAEFVMGVRNIDKDWDAYVNDLKSNDLERYLELSQQQYEANKK